MTFALSSSSRSSSFHGSAAQAPEDAENEAFGVADDFLVPQMSGLDVEVSRIAELSTFRSDVMSVVAEPGRLVAADGYGNLVVGLLRDPQKGEEQGEDDRNNEGRHTKPSTPGSKNQVYESYALQPARYEYGEEGWTGVALEPSPRSSLLACARHFFRDVTIYDRDLPVRTFYTSALPSAVQFTHHGSVAVAENHVVSLWDLRAGEMSGSTWRKSVCADRIYCMDVRDHYLAVSGADRVVRVLDLRTMRPVGQWNNCLKYACRALHLHAGQETCYVVGIDNEVSFGRWGIRDKAQRTDESQRQPPSMVSGALARSPRRMFGFRGDARWVGACTAGDTFAALSMTGAFYVLRPN